MPFFGGSLYSFLPGAHDISFYYVPAGSNYPIYEQYTALAQSIAENGTNADTCTARVLDAWVNVETFLGRILDLFQRLQGETSDSSDFATQTSFTVLQNALDETRILTELQPSEIDTERLTSILLSRIDVTKSVVSIVVDLIREILSREDYISIVEQLSEASDVEILLDFMLLVLRGEGLSNLNPTVDINRRARRFMLKVISRVPVIPTSLIVTAVTMPAGSNYIGGGGFGRVSKGKLWGVTVALKVLYKSDNNAAFCREALMWGSLEHKFVLPFLGIHEVVKEAVSQFYLVSPYMINGTLAQWRKTANPSTIKIEGLILEVAEGLEYIHSEDIVHGDIRGDNVLLDDNLHVQIADFGLTRLSEATNTRSGALHVNFAAPELFGFTDDDDDPSDDTPARTQMSDIYAFGCLYYEIHYDAVPFAGIPEMRIWTMVSRRKLPPRLDEPPLSDESWELIQHCWMRMPSERPEIKAIVERMTLMSEASPAPADI